MADVTSGITIKRLGNDEAGALIVTTAATVDDGDTFTITLADYGISTFLGILGQTHSTTDSVVITEAPTTAVSTGVLTVTVGGSTDNKKRAFIIWGE